MNFSDSLFHGVKSNLRVSRNEYTWFLYILPTDESQTLSSRDTALTPLRMLLTGFARPHPSRLLLIADLKEIRSLCIVYERRDCSTTSERSRNACCLQCRGSGCTDGAWRSDSPRDWKLLHFYNHEDIKTTSDSSPLAAIGDSRQVWLNWPFTLCFYTPRNIN